MLKKTKGRKLCRWVVEIIPASEKIVCDICEELDGVIQDEFDPDTWYCPNCCSDILKLLPRMEQLFLLRQLRKYCI